MVSLKGLIAVLVTGAILAVPLYFYWEFLTQGMQPSVATIKLNEIERSGFPDFSVQDMSGESVRLYSFKGRPVILNLWATWCAPCVKEFPSLKRLVEHYKGELVVVAVSHDQAKEDVEAFLKAFGGVPKDLVVLWDKERITGQLLGTQQLPETFILNREMKLVRKIAGEQVWDDVRALEFFSETLGL